MSWVFRNNKLSNDQCFYDLDIGCDIYRELSKLSIDDLNDPDRDFALTHNDLFAKEFNARDPNSIDQLPAGVYRLDCPNIYESFKLIPWKFDSSTKLFKLDIVKDVLKDYEDFKKDKDIYKNLKLKYKRGVLLYGPAGTGKTTAVNMILESIISDDIIVFYVDNVLPTMFLKTMKSEKRLKIFIFEELTQTVSEHNINRFLTFLDGENSLDNCYTLATTNYPESLPGNIVNRPGRFDKLFPIDVVNNKDKKIYLEYYLKRAITSAELKIVNTFTMAFLKELVLLVIRNKWSFNQAVKSLKDHQAVVKRAFKKQSTEIGFLDDDD